MIRGLVGGALLLLLALIWSAAASSDDPVAITVYPLQAHSPATLLVRVRTARHADNRALCVSYDGPEYKRSCRTLNGSSDARTWTLYWSFRIGGEYRAVAELIRVEQGQVRQYVAAQAFQIMGWE